MVLWIVKFFCIVFFDPPAILPAGCYPLLAA